jgi:hypothetical protein
MVNGSIVRNRSVKNPKRKPIIREPESPIKILFVPEDKLYLKNAANIAITERLIRKEKSRLVKKNITA